MLLCSFVVCSMFCVMYTAFFRVAVIIAEVLTCVSYRSRMRYIPLLKNIDHVTDHDGSLHILTFLNDNAPLVRSFFFLNSFCVLNVDILSMKSKV